jgi:hypothetical protein
MTYRDVLKLGSAGPSDHGPAWRVQRLAVLVERDRRRSVASVTVETAEAERRPLVELLLWFVRDLERLPWPRRCHANTNKGPGAETRLSSEDQPRQGQRDLTLVRASITIIKGEDDDAS